MSPVLPAARTLMHDIDQGKIGGQEAFSRMVELHAALETHRVQAATQGFAAEKEKLGANATVRVTAVQNFLKAQLGEDLAKAMNSGLITARHVEGMEKLMTAFKSQGAGSYSQNGRGPDDVPRATPEQWDKMNYSQKKDYTARFPNGNGAA